MIQAERNYIIILIKNPLPFQGHPPRKHPKQFQGEPISNKATLYFYTQAILECVIKMTYGATLELLKLTEGEEFIGALIDMGEDLAFARPGHSTERRLRTQIRSMLLHSIRAVVGAKCYVQALAEDPCQPSLKSKFELQSGWNPTTTCKGQLVLHHIQPRSDNELKLSKKVEATINQKQSSEERSAAIQPLLDEAKNRCAVLCTRHHGALHNTKCLNRR